MDKEKFDLERWAIAENLSKNFHINGEGWDASDFEWASHCLQMDGYRKSEDVAREIFEEIEKKVKASITVHLEEINKEHIKDTPLYDRHSGIIFALKGMDDFLAKLKKKYKSEDFIPAPPHTCQVEIPKYYESIINQVFPENEDTE